MLQSPSGYITQAKALLHGGISFEDLLRAVEEYRQWGEIGSQYPAFIAFNAIQHVRGPHAGTGTRLRCGLASGVTPLREDEDWGALCERAALILGSSDA